jgi:hypothetical protein
LALAVEATGELGGVLFAVEAGSASKTTSTLKTG